MKNNQEKKAIALIRTSTIRQEVEAQRKEVLEFAAADGFTEENIIVIGGAGASAIKLDDEYKRNMADLYTTIEENEVACVYAWAIDRIGRNEEVLMHLKNYLIGKKINLKIKNPNLSLLDENGAVNNGIEISFSLFAVLAKQEMEQKKERFARTRKRKAEEGKYNGGKIRYGYKTENGFLVVSEPEAENIRALFDEYVNTPIGTKKLGEKAYQMGVTKAKYNQGQFMLSLLHFEGYAGEGIYPAIIDKQTFLLAEEKLKNKKNSAKINYKSDIYYCQNIVKEMFLGFENEMKIYKLFPRKYHQYYVSTNSSLAINIAALDSAALYVVNKLLQESDNTDIIKEAEERREIVNNRIAIIEEKISEKTKKIEELQDRYFSAGNISTTTYERNLKALTAAVDNLYNDLSEERNNLLKIKDLEVEKIDLYALDDEARQKAIWKFVQSIIIKKIEKSVFHANFVTNRFFDTDFSCDINTRKKTITFMNKENEPQTVEFPVVRDLPRVKRVWKDGHYLRILE